MSISNFLFAGVVIYLVLSAIWSIIFKRKVIIRLICALVAMATALVGTFVFKATLDDHAKLIDVISRIPGTEKLLQTLNSLTEASEPLANAVTSFLSAAAAPTLFFSIFTIALSLSFVLRAILSLVLLILGVKRKPGIISKGVFGLAYGLIVLFCMLVPITAYMDVAEEAMPYVDATLQAATGESNELAQKRVEEFNDSAVVKIHGALGGSLINKSLTSITFNADGQKVKTNLAAEIGPMLKLTSTVTELAKVPMDQYTDNETAKIESIAASLPDSKLISVTVSEVIYISSDAWLNGESFIGIAKPSIGEDFDPMLDKTLEILHNDAKNINYLREDLTTVAKMVSKLFAYKSSQQSDGAANIDSDAVRELISGLLTELSKNERMRPIIPVVTNIGIKMLADTLGIPSSGDAAYNEMCEDIAKDLVKTAALPSDERIVSMKNTLQACFSSLGSGSIGDSETAIIASAVISYFNGKETVTASDVDAFLRELTANFDDIQSGTVPVSTPSAAAEAGLLLKKLWLIRSNTSLTPEQKAEQCAQAFASSDMTTSSGMSPALVDEFKNIIIADASGITPDDARMHLKTIAAITDSTHSAFGVTLQDILVDTSVFDDPDAVSNEELTNIISAVSDTFGKIVDLGGEENADISGICKTFGSLLDTFENSPNFYGEEKTKVLIEAILKSDTIKQSTGISSEEVNILLQSRNEKDISYSALMGTVSETAELFDSIKKGEEINEEKIKDLMDSLANEGAGAVIADTVTEERLKEIGFSDNGIEGSVAGAAQLLSNVFKGISAIPDPTERSKEADAVKHLINIALDSNKNVDPDANAFGDEQSRFGCTAEEMLDTILESTVLTDALDKSELTSNPFGLKLTESDRSALSSVLQDRLDAAETQEREHTVEKLACLLGIALV